MTQFIGMEDIRKHGDQELKLRVLNDEYFYDLIKKRDWLYTEIADQFIYSDKQFIELEKVVDEIHEKVWPQPIHVGGGLYVS